MCSFIRFSYCSLIVTHGSASCKDSPNGNHALCLPVASSLLQYFPNFLDTRKNAPKGLDQAEGEEWRKARQMLSPAFSTAKMRLVSLVKGIEYNYWDLKYTLASTSDGSPCEEQPWDIGWEAGRVRRAWEKCGCLQVCMCTGVLFFWHATMYCGLLSYTHTHTHTYTNTCTPTCMQQLQIFHHGNHSSRCFRPGREPPTRGSWSTHWCLFSPLLKHPGGRGVISWILNPFAEWVVNWVWKPHFQALRRWIGVPGIHRSHTHVVELYSHVRTVVPGRCSSPLLSTWERGYRYGMEKATEYHLEAAKDSMCYVIPWGWLCFAWNGSGTWPYSSHLSLRNLISYVIQSWVTWCNMSATKMLELQSPPPPPPLPNISPLPSSPLPPFSVSPSACDLFLRGR